MEDQEQEQKQFQQQLQEIESRHSTGSGSNWDEELNRRNEENEKARILKEIKKIPDKYREIETEKDIFPFLYRNVFLWGKCGTGKTVFGLSIAKAKIGGGHGFCYLSYPKFIMQIQNYYRDESKSPYDEVLKIARSPGVLFIDDLGAEKLTEFVRQTTYFLINEREQWDLPLIITSNFSLAQLSDQIDVRIASRIAGICEVVEICGPDKRIKK